MTDNKELFGEQTNSLNDVDQLMNDFDDAKVNEDKSFRKGDMMVLIADYTDDSDYAVYINMEDELHENKSQVLNDQGTAETKEDLAKSDFDSIIIDTTIKDLDEEYFTSSYSNSSFEDSETAEMNFEESGSDASVENLYAAINDDFAPSSSRRFNNTTENKDFIDELQTSSPKKDVKETDRKKNNKFKGIITAAVILIAIIGVMAFRYSTIKVFPAGSTINGIDVSDLNVKAAAKKMDSDKNKIRLFKDGKNLGEADTVFKFESKKAMEKALVRAAIDPYAIYKLRTKEGLKAPLKVVGGIDQTVPLLLNVDVDNANVEQTKDAYVDLDKGEIVAEFQGKNVDYKKVSKKIAEQLENNPVKPSFEYKSKDFYARPKVKSGDLKGELDFVKKYIVAGMDVDTPGGTTIHITPAELNKIIQYSKKGPKYSHEGADEVAKIVIEKYKGEESVITINTTYGPKKMTNYDFNADADEKQTAKDIYEAAKEKRKAKIVVSDKNNLNLANRVEINLSAQSMTLVLNNEASASWPIVSGGPGHRTPTGLFALAYKTSPATLKGLNDDGSKYESKVTYWMPFNGGIGIHDADGWRATYGGSIYVYGGSHGCINAPSVAARTIYNSIGSGTPILVFN